MKALLSEKLRLHVLSSCLTQLLCVAGVQMLASRTSALTLNFALALRKFASLLLSAFLFSNELHLRHIIGGILVLGGSILYALRPSMPTKMDEKKKEI